MSALNSPTFFFFCMHIYSLCMVNSRSWHIENRTRGNVCLLSIYVILREVSQRISVDLLNGSRQAERVICNYKKKKKIRWWATLFTNLRNSTLETSYVSTCRRDEVDCTHFDRAIGRIHTMRSSVTITLPARDERLAGDRARQRVHAPFTQNVAMWHAAYTEYQQRIPCSCWDVPTITYYWTRLLIMDHTLYLVGNFTNSKIAETKAIELLQSWHLCMSNFWTSLFPNEIWVVQDWGHCPIIGDPAVLALYDRQQRTTIDRLTEPRVTRAASVSRWVRRALMLVLLWHGSSQSSENMGKPQQHITMLCMRCAAYGCNNTVSMSQKSCLYRHSWN